MMLKFLPLSVTISVTIISSLSLLAHATQEDTLCFMVNSSGQVVSLDNLCDQRRYNTDSASVCEEPFDRDGFPISLYPELNRLKAAVATKQKKVFNSNESHSESARENLDPDEELAMVNLINKMNNLIANIPSYARMQEIQKKLSVVYSQSPNVNEEEVKKLEEENEKARQDLLNDSCYKNITQSFIKKINDLREL